VACGESSTARDRRLGRDVAVKEVLVTDAGLVSRVDREVRLTARLQHPGIVSIYAMRPISGRPFNESIERATTLPERLALVQNVVAIAEALAYAHG
jgi:eukaryotic-like serine/threonine-protein kinase